MVINIVDVDGVVVSILVCYAEDTGSTPGRDTYIFFLFEKITEYTCVFLMLYGCEKSFYSKTLSLYGEKRILFFIIAIIALHQH